MKMNRKRLSDILQMYIRLVLPSLSPAEVHRVAFNFLDKNVSQVSTLMSVFFSSLRVYQQQVMITLELEQHARAYAKIIAFLIVPGRGFQPSKTSFGFEIFFKLLTFKKDFKFISKTCLRIKESPKALKRFLFTKVISEFSIEIALQLVAHSLLGCSRGD